MREGAREAFIEDARQNVKAPSDLTKEKALDELGVTDANERKFTSKDKALAMWCERFGQEKAEEIGDANWRKTSFDATQGHICCIGWAVDDGEPFSDYIQTINDERDVLRCFFSDLHKHFDVRRRPLFVGHNHVGFDLPFIYRRAVILGVEPPKFLPSVPRPWDESVYDTMYQWAGHGNRISMDALCHALGIPGKDGMDGSMVCDAFLQGRIAGIAEYCRGDVVRTREIYKRMTFYPGALAVGPELNEADIIPPWEREAA
ncbi:MAG: ribonuclease H-like domain-containing protein [Afipia sp.]